jgi:hypothetical protein
MNRHDAPTTHDLIEPSLAPPKIHQCLRCNLPKPIKAKGLCNSFYTHESREKSKKSTDSDKIRELEQELKKEREKNALLMGKGAYSTQDQITPVVVWNDCTPFNTMKITQHFHTFFSRNLCRRIDIFWVWSIPLFVWWAFDRSIVTQMTFTISRHGREINKTFH